jgi:hypothetical protein
VSDETWNPVIDIHTHLSSRAQSVNGAGIGEKMKFRCHPGNSFAGHGQEELPVMVKPLGRLSFTTGIPLTSCFRGFDLPTTL